MKRSVVVGGILFAFAASSRAHMPDFSLNNGDLQAELNGLRTVASNAPASATYSAAGAGWDGRAVYRCQYDVAVYGDQHDTAVYRRVYRYTNRCGGLLDGVGAQRVSQLAAQGEINADKFLRNYWDSCHFDTAIRAGAVRGGVCAVYFRVYKFFNRCDSRIDNVEAQLVSQLAARGEINVDKFLRVYWDRCLFDSAVKVACQKKE